MFFGQFVLEYGKGDLFDYGLLAQEMNESTLLSQLALQLNVCEQVSASM